jgi:monoamine oxidase
MSARREIAGTADVVVVGAGLAGLTAARELRLAGARVTTLEARSRAGGRAWTKPDALAGNPFEMGGMLVDASQAAITAALRRYGLTTSPVADVRSTAWWTGGQRRTSLLPVPAAELPDLERAIRAWQDAAAAPDDPALDGVSVESYFTAVPLGPHARDLLDAFFSEHASGSWASMSMRSMAEDLARAGGSVTAWIAAATLAHTVDGGIGRLVERLRDDAGNIHYNAPVHAIIDDPDGVTVQTDGGTVRAAYAVLAAPLNTWKNISVTPAWPDSAAALIARGHAGRGYKVGLEVSGSAPDFALAAGSNLHAFMTLRRRPDGSRTAVAFGPDPTTIDPADTDALGRIIAPVAPHARVLAATTHNWVDDPWSLGTWVVHHPATTQEEIDAVSRPHGRIVPAGSDVATASASYLDGAIQSGHCAALHVSQALRINEMAGLH